MNAGRLLRIIVLEKALLETYIGMVAVWSHRQARLIEFHLLDIHCRCDIPRALLRVRDKIFVNKPIGFNTEHCAERVYLSISAADFF